MQIGVNDLLADLRSTNGLLATGRESEPQLRVILDMFESEAANLKDWKLGQPASTSNPSFFAQQLYNRAAELEARELAAAAEARLRALGKPHLLIHWRARQEAPVAAPAPECRTWIERLLGFSSSARKPREKTISSVAITP